MKPEKIQEYAEMMQEALDHGDWYGSDGKREVAGAASAQAQVVQALALLEILKVLRAAGPSGVDVTEDKVRTKDTSIGAGIADPRE